ncbi:MAG: PP2C family serine/threonine-protein phosphatase [Polyangiaceae bacterium]
MRAIAAGVTDVGRERDHNEDRFVLVPEFEVFVVADGMGGHQCGEVASRMATATIAAFFRENRHNGVDVGELLSASVREANARIHGRAISSTMHRGMGTTVVAAALSRHEGKICVAHAGDSRCYRLRDDKLVQLTRDHSLVEEALRTRPDITKSELAYLPGNVITRALGVEPHVDLELMEELVEVGDLYLLCSDGLHGFVSDERIEEILQAATIITSACADLVGEANENGGGDNITAVLIRIEELDEPWATSTSVPPAPSRSGRGGPDSLRLASLGSGRLPDVTTSDSAEVISTSTDADAAKAQLEADDTAQHFAVLDPDAVLEAAGDADPEADTPLPEAAEEDDDV